MSEDLKILVLNEIREINKDKLAQQADLMTALDITHDDVVLILNILHSEGKIQCHSKIKNRGLDNKELKFLEFAHITTKS